MALCIVPVTYRQACDFIDAHHRHHRAPQGWKFGCGAAEGDKPDRLVGVVVVGRTVARQLDDGLTLEVTRLATDGMPHAKNAASMLYAAAWQAARALGYKRLITYILDTEPGTSLRAAGFVKVSDIRARDWNCPARPRDTATTVTAVAKRQLYQITRP